MSDKKRAAATMKLPLVTTPGEGSVLSVDMTALRTALLA
jgi:hypothetical protein